MENFLRVINFATKDFLRNKGISLSAVFALVVIVMIVTGILFCRGMADYLIFQLQEKIDITAYFYQEAQEQDILAVKDELSGFDFIKNIEYVSKEEAIEDFKQKYKDNDDFSRALAEVGGNPFLPASLNIRTYGDPAQFKAVSDILSQKEYSDMIERIDFGEKKYIIDKVFAVRSGITRVGLVLVILIIVIAVMVVFNTVKLAVNSSKEEISTMKIVGASNWFIRGPFIIQGIIYGLIAFAVCFVVSLIGSHLLSDKILIILPGFNIFGYFISNMWIFILVQAGFGVGVGVISSFFAVKKHLK